MRNLCHIENSAYKLLLLRSMCAYGAKIVLYALYSMSMQWVISFFLKILNLYFNIWHCEIYHGIPKFKLRLLEIRVKLIAKV